MGEEKHTDYSRQLEKLLRKNRFNLNLFGHISFCFIVTTLLFADVQLWDMKDFIQCVSGNVIALFSVYLYWIEKHQLVIIIFDSFLQA